MIRYVNIVRTSTPRGWSARGQYRMGAGSEKGAFVNPLHTLTSGLFSIGRNYKVAQCGKKKTLCKQMKFPRAPDLAANLETPPPDHQLPSRLFNHFLAHQHYSGSSTTPPALRLLPPPPLINCLSLARQLPAQLLNRIIGSFPQLVPRHYSSVGTISLSGVVKGSSLDLL